MRCQILFAISSLPIVLTYMLEKSKKFEIDEGVPKVSDNNSSSLKIETLLLQQSTKTKTGILSSQHEAYEIPDLGEELLPKNFDVRRKWPKCNDIISRVRDQGICGSCWATHAASVMSDRLCIESKGNTKVHISAVDIFTCCGTACLVNKRKICNAGYALSAFKFLHEKGAVTEECKPYPRDQLDRLPRQLPCVEKCTNGSYEKSYQNDKHYASLWYRVRPSLDVEMIQKEIFVFGPVEARVKVYADFEIYRKGIYVRNKASIFQYNHYVKIIGWGEESGVKYWLGMNSDGTTWGLQGLFKIVKGVNMCGIEKYVFGARSSHYRRELLLNHGPLWQPGSVRCMGFILLLSFTS